VINQNNKYFETDLSKNVFVTNLNKVTLDPEDDDKIKNETFAECIKKLDETSVIDLQKRESLIDQYVVIKQ